jgi:hypothetical protein
MKLLLSAGDQILDPTGYRQRLQSCSQRFCEKLQAVHRTHRREHMGGISALPTSGLNHSKLREPG